MKGHRSPAKRYPQAGGFTKAESVGAVDGAESVLVLGYQ